MANESHIDGHQNVVIQGVSFSKIEVNVTNIDVESLVSEILNAGKALRIMVLTTLPEWLEKYSEVKFSELSDYYGKERHEWKPFKEETIFDLLKYYNEKSGFRLKVFILDAQDEASPSFITKLKSMSPKTIFLIDTFALQRIGNRELGKQVLNQPSVGA